MAAHVEPRRAALREKPSASLDGLILYVYVPNMGSTRWFADVRSVRLGSSDLDTSVRFATEILGLELVRRDGRRAYLRAGAGRDHHLEYVRGEAGAGSLAFETGSREALEALAAGLVRGGHAVREASRAECDERYTEAAYVVSDPTGNRLDLAHGGPSVEVWAPARDAGITSFSHVGLRTSSAPRDETFWTGALGARVSDWIGDVPLLRLDGVHHRVALFPSTRPGVQHVNFQVAGVDDVMRSYYFLRGRGVPVVFGPGRHPTSGAIFLYFQGPDGFVYEYSTGVSTIDDEVGHRPRRFPFEPSSFCLWGARPDIPEFRAASGAP